MVKYKINEMCLEAKQKPEVLEEDLIVYKNFKSYVYEDLEIVGIRSFYKRYLYDLKIGETNTFHAEFIKSELQELEKHDYSEISEGIHCFVFIEAALQDLDSEGFCVRCTIPKGTRILRGYFCGESSIATEAIRISFQDLELAKTYYSR